MRKSNSGLREKILLSLLHGIAFGCAVTPSQQNRVLRDFAKIWGASSKQVSNEIRNLDRTELIKKIYKTKDRNYQIELTEKGKLKAVECNLIRRLKIKDKKWDGKWRMLIFDVPERLRNGRNALRWKIKRLGFYELQKSVFVIPYECKKEIDLVVSFFDLKSYVHYGVLEIKGEEINQKLKKQFGLSTEN
jgi:DNA-binding transcriptional regulator PaaX